MSLIADGLLIATCLTAAMYCYVLSRRLKQFSNTEEGVGKQVRDLNVALEETRAALKEAQSGAAAATDALSQEVAKAKKMAAQLRALGAGAAVASPAPAVQPASPQQATSPSPGPVERGKLEAIQHPEPEFTATVADDDEDLAELDLEKILDAAPGEQQLGFLPDEDEGEEDPVEQAASDVVADPAKPATAASTSTDENLLKVERMAL